MGRLTEMLLNKKQHFGNPIFRKTMDRAGGEGGIIIENIVSWVQDNLLQRAIKKENLRGGIFEILKCFG